MNHPENRLECATHGPDCCGISKNCELVHSDLPDETKAPHPDCVTPVSDGRLREILVSFISALQQNAPKEHNIDMQWNEGLSILREVIAGRACETPAGPPPLTLRDFGYAPGGYSIWCDDCKQMADGCDKRAGRCLPCATKKLAGSPVKATSPLTADSTRIDAEQFREQK